MILQAAEKLALDLSRSWLIGDAPRDIEAGKAAGCRTILFQDPTLPASPAASATPTVLPDHYVQSLKDALDIIERESRTPDEAPNDPAVAYDAPQSPEHPVAPDAPIKLPTVVTPPPSSHDVAPPTASSIIVDLQKLETLAEQILQEMRKPAPAAPAALSTAPAAVPRAPAASAPAVEPHFSISKMVAGIVQVLALAVLALAYKAENPQNTLLLAIVLQLFTIALLIMGRQR